MSRGALKALTSDFNFPEMHQRILTPTGITNNSQKTNIPFVYRDLDECMALITECVNPVAQLRAIGYVEHLKRTGVVGKTKGKGHHIRKAPTTPVSMRSN